MVLGQGLRPARRRPWAWRRSWPRRPVRTLRAVCTAPGGLVLADAQLAGDGRQATGAELRSHEVDEAGDSLPLLVVRRSLFDANASCQLAPRASLASRPGPSRQEQMSGPATPGFSLGRHAPAVAARLRSWQEEAPSPASGPRTTPSGPPSPCRRSTTASAGSPCPRPCGSEVPALVAFAAEVAADGITRVVLLGMGGSSLAPEVFARTFGSRPGYPELLVLDSTHPGAVRAVDEQVDPAATLFLVSSKSGTTIEPLSFLHHCWARASAATPHARPPLRRHHRPGHPAGRPGPGAGLPPGVRRHPGRRRALLGPVATSAWCRPP